MPVPALKATVPQTTDPQAVRQSIVGIREDLARLNLGIANETSGTPTDAPAARTMRFDTATKRLWIYDGAAWRYVVLT